MSQNLNLIFAGTPDFAAASLQALLDSPHRVVAVYTQPDRQSGRGKKISMSPVKELALQHNIAVEQPDNFNSEHAQKTLANYQADAMIVAAYGLLLPQAVLDIPKLGCINVHGSLLPRWRGAAPIQRAIQAGDAKSGITIMQMEAGLDTGPMLAKTTVAITDTDTGSSLHDKLAIAGADLLVDTLHQLTASSARATAQDEDQATYAHKLNKREAMLDWSQSADSLHRTIRAFNSWPVAQTQIDGQTVRVWQATVAAPDCKDNVPAGTIIQASKEGLRVACGQGELLLTQLQLPGSRKMAVNDLLNAPKNRELLLKGRQFTSSNNS